MKKIYLIIFILFISSFQLFATNPDPPEKVTAISDGSSITLTWDIVDGAQSYNIYASVKPYSDFQDLTVFGDFNNDTSWTIPYADKKLFLYVVSSSDERKSVKIENVTSELILEYLTKEIDVRD